MDSDIDSNSDSDSDSDSDDDCESDSDSKEESFTDDKNQGFLQKFWPTSDVSSRQLPRSVLFVTDGDSQETHKEEELELNGNFEDMCYTENEDNNQSLHTLNTNNNNIGWKVIGAMTDIGGVFFCKKENPKDARALRMLDSDITNSSDEDDDDDPFSCDSSSQQENTEHSRQGSNN